MCRSDEEILQAVGPDPALVLVDAPLVVPDVRGRRDAEHVLAWLDIPAFPVTPSRMAKVHGGARGVAVADALAGMGHVVAEALPDQVLRQAMWERDHPPGGPVLDLAAYRAAWLGVRPFPAGEGSGEHGKRAGGHHTASLARCDASESTWCRTPAPRTLRGCPQ